MAQPARVLHRHLGLQTRVLPGALPYLAPGRQGAFQRFPVERTGRPLQEGFGGRVGVGDPRLHVHDEHAVGHLGEHAAPRDRHQIGERIAEHHQDEQAGADHKDNRREVQGQRAHARQQEEGPVQPGGEQRRGPAPAAVEGGPLAQRRIEPYRAADEQDRVIADVQPGPRSVACHRRLERPGAHEGDVGINQAAQRRVRIGQSQGHRQDAGQAEQQQDSWPQPALLARLLQREHKPGDRHGDDAR